MNEKCLRSETWLRQFNFGHVRQLARVTEMMLTRAWAAGAGPGDGHMFIDMDSTICEVHGYAKQGATHGYTKTKGDHPLLAIRADTGEVLHGRMRKSSAGSGRGAQRFVRETVGRSAACVDHRIDFSITTLVRSAALRARRTRRWRSSCGRCCRAPTTTRPRASRL